MHDLHRFPPKASSLLSIVRKSAAALLARLTREPRDPDEARVAGPGRTQAGISMSPDTAVKVSAVWACLRYVSQTVAVLPWHVHLERDAGAEPQYSHPVDYLIWKRPNPEWSSFQFRETLAHWALRWGNGYAEIERDQLGRPFALWPIHPDRVDVCRDPETGRLYYEVNNGTGGKVEIDAQDMFHLRGFGEGVVGVNVIAYAAQSLGWAYAAQLFGASFFGNGMNLAGVVVNKKPLSPDGLKLQKAEFESLYKGRSGWHKTAFLDGDADWKPIGIVPKDAMLVDVHYFLIEEICRWFGVPPHKVAHLLRATFSNIEHQAIEVVVDCITPWVKRFEDEADVKLFGQNRRGYVTKMNMRGLLRGDFKSQNEGFEVARRNGVINADEWRAYLDMAPMKTGAGGDKYVMQSHNTTLERIGEEPVDPPELPSPPEPDPVEEDPAAQAARADFERLMARVDA